MRAILTRLPPPLLFVATFVAGLQLPGVQARPASFLSLGGGLVIAGVVIALTSAAIFALRRTTIIPHHRARMLVTYGPFRFSRNPMYVALAIIYVGASLVVHSLWLLPWLALPLLYLQLITIPIEERILLNAFAGEYQAYASRVRRWI